MQRELKGNQAVLQLKFSEVAMGAAAILLLVVGCSGGAEDCRELPAPAPHYASMQDCEHDKTLVATHNRNDYDHIFGACAAFDADMIGSDAEIVWDVSMEEGLVVAVEPMWSEEVYVLARTAAPEVHRY